MPQKIGYERPVVGAERPKYEFDEDKAEAARFYAGARWRSVRLIKLWMNPVCECSPECLKPAKDVHHRVERKVDPSRAYDLSNLVSMAHECHSRETMRRVHEKNKAT